MPLLVPNFPQPQPCWPQSTKRPHQPCWMATCVRGVAVLGCGKPGAGTSRVRRRRRCCLSECMSPPRTGKFRDWSRPRISRGSNSCSDADLTMDTVRALVLWSPNCLGSGGRCGWWLGRPLPHVPSACHPDQESRGASHAGWVNLDRHMSRWPIGGSDAVSACHESLSRRSSHAPEATQSV
jgi:hypothetical protein